MPRRGEWGHEPVHRIEMVRGMADHTVDSEWVRRALHDLSQPMTALECGLFIGTMSPDGVRAPTARELLETILQALQQCERMSMQLRAMQERMNS